MTESRRTIPGPLFIALAAALWGLWPAWVHYGRAGGATATIALLVTGVLGAPVALREGRGRQRSWREVGLLLGLGASDAGNALAYFLALAVGPVAPATITHYLAPVLVALAAPAVLKEPAGRRTPLALVMALAGTVAIVSSESTTSGDPRRAALYGGTSAVFYATNVLLSRRLCTSFGPGEILAYHCLVSGALLVPVTGLPRTALPWLVVGAGAVVSSLLAGMLFLAGLRTTPAERAGVLTYVEPVAAVATGALLLGDPPSSTALAGGALVLGAGLLIATEPHVVKPR